MNARFDLLLGKDRNDVAAAFERICQQWLEKKYAGRKFQRNVEFACPKDGEGEVSQYNVHNNAD